MNTDSLSETKPTLPDFTRWQWAGRTERAFWKPLFGEASRAFEVLERLSVVEGIRPAAYQFTNLTEAPRMAEWASQNGLIMVPVGTGVLATSYSATDPAGVAPNGLRVLYVKPEHYPKVFPFTTSDHIGDLLGFPECCRKAFDATWGRGQIDSTFEQAAATGTRNPLTSTLMRWMGVRMVPHMPCSFDCEASGRLGTAFAELGVKHGLTEQMALVKEVLQWPMHANRLFGIAEMTTPALRLVTRTDWTGTKEEFTFSGSYNKPEETLWTDNGYSDFEPMRTVHSFLLQTLGAMVDQGARLVDLGCGNGHLLHRFKSFWRPDVKIAGIDTNADAIRRAPALVGKWWTGSIESGVWEGWNPTAALITPGRLLEMTPEDADATRARLKKVPQVFCYSYSDWQKHGTLDEICTQAGLGPIQMLHKSPTLQVGLLA